MNNLEILGLSVNSIRYRNLRSWLAILGVVIGVASIVSLISISTGLQDQIKSQISGLGAQVITVSPGGGQASRGGFGDAPGGGGGSTSTKPITFKEAEDIRSVAGVSLVDPRLQTRATISYRIKNSSVTVIGTDPTAFLKASTVVIAQGRSLRASDKNAAVLGAQVVNRTFQGEDLLNKQIKIDGQPFRVVGILNATGASFGGQTATSSFPSRPPRASLTTRTTPAPSSWWPKMAGTPTALPPPSRLCWRACIG